MACLLHLQYSEAFYRVTCGEIEKRPFFLPDELSKVKI